MTIKCSWIFRQCNPFQYLLIKRSIFQKIYIPQRIHTHSQSLQTLTTTKFYRNLTPHIFVQPWTWPPPWDIYKVTSFDVRCEFWHYLMYNSCPGSIHRYTDNLARVIPLATRKTEDPSILPLLSSMNLSMAN